MPNWCNTFITFYSKNANQINDLHNQICKIYDAESTVSNDFGHGWLGDFVNTLLSPEYTHDTIKCRGWIDQIEEVEQAEDVSFFSIQQESAWSPHLRMWCQICDKLFPDVEIAYEAEEGGNCVYLQYDRSGNFYLDECYMDTYEAGIDSYWGDLKDCLADLRDKYPDMPQTKNVDTINDFFRGLFANAPNGTYIQINVFETLNPWDCD